MVSYFSRALHEPYESPVAPAVEYEEDEADDEDEEDEADKEYEEDEADE